MRFLLLTALCVGFVGGFRIPGGTRTPALGIDRGRQSRYPGGQTVGRWLRLQAPCRHLTCRYVSTSDCDVAELSRSGQWGEALKALDDMERTATSPTKTAYTAVMGALTSNGQWEQALEIYERAFGADGELASQADTSTYEAGIAACAKGRRWERAFEIYDDLEQSGVATGFTQSSLEALCKHEAARSFQLLEASSDNFPARRLRPNHFPAPCDVSSSAKWVEDNAADAAQILVDEGMLWVRGACEDAALLADAALQVDQNLVTALASASADDVRSKEEQVRWFGRIRARTHRYDLRQRLVGPVQQVVQEVASKVQAALSLAMLSSADAEVVEFSCIIADPGAPAQALHYDTPLLPEEGGYDGSGASLFTIFIPLQDVAADMGATCLLPRSHTSVEAHRAFAQDRARHDKREKEKSEREPARAYLGEALVQDAARECRVFAGPVTAGDAMVMDSRTLHCGGENTSDKRRRLLYVTFHCGTVAPSADQEGVARRPAHSTYSLLDEYAGMLKLSAAGEWEEVTCASR